MPKKAGDKSILGDILVVICATVLLVFIAEGIASFILLSAELKNTRIPAERRHTEYDALLGWINKRNVHIPDMYGPGIYVRTNAQRFRNKRTFDTISPSGKRRWICCGDSFTFGYGVDNDHTWCALLPGMIPGIEETINMGQGGYGLDQMYLWYLRDGRPLEHDVLIVAFITEDIPRMALDKFLNYPRPQLSIQNGQIVNRNTPVPKPGLLTEKLPRLAPLVARLSVVRLANQMISSFKSGAPATESKMAQPDLLKLTLAIFADLNDSTRSRNRSVIFVHLPVEKDYKVSPQADSFRAFLHKESRKAAWHYIDLITDLRALQPAEVSGLFIQKDLPAYVDARGHYSEVGNRFIAGRLAQKIRLHFSEYRK